VAFVGRVPAARGEAGRRTMASAPSEKKPAPLSKEVRLLLAQANVTPELAEEKLLQRAGAQMQEYLKVASYRLDREHMTSAVDAGQAAQINELLACLNQRERAR